MTNIPFYTILPIVIETKMLVFSGLILAGCFWSFALLEIFKYIACWGLQFIWKCCDTGYNITLFDMLVVSTFQFLPCWKSSKYIAFSPGRFCGLQRTAVFGQKGRKWTRRIFPCIDKCSRSHSSKIPQEADFKRYKQKKEYMNKITCTGPFTIGQFT